MKPPQLVDADGQNFSGVKGVVVAYIEGRHKVALGVFKRK
jgi:hypothetical protein